MSAEGVVSSQELACIYSAAILADDDIPVTADKMVTLIRAAGVNVEPVWPALYAKALQTVDIKQFITRVGPAPIGGGAGTQTAGDTVTGDTKQDTTPDTGTAVVEEESDDDEDMGLSLFD